MTRDRRRGKRAGLLWGMSGAALVGLVAYATIATGLLGGTQASGEPVPDVSLTTENGEYRLSQQKGKVVVLYFSFPG